MSKETLKNKIDSDINTNGLQQITGEKLNNILNDIVDEMALGGGVVEEDNPNAVSGGEVFNVTKDYYKLEEIDLTPIHSTNIIDPSEVELNTSLHETGVVPSANYNTSGYIKIKPNTLYKGINNYFSTNNVFRLSQQYDADFNLISGTYITSYHNTINTVSSAKYVRVSFPNGTIPNYTDDVTQTGLFEGNATIFEKYIKEVIYSIENDAKTTSKGDNDIATIKDVININNSKGLTFDINLNNELEIKYNNGELKLLPYEQRGYNGNNMFNFTHSIINGISVSSNDDVAPMHILNSTMGANHGYNHYHATITSHGFTNADIGTEFDKSGVKFYILRIVDANTVAFISQNNGTSSSPSFVALTTGNIIRGAESYTISSVQSKQLYPSIGDLTKNIVVNGEKEIHQGYIGEASKVEAIESYVIYDPTSVLNNTIARAGQSQEPTMIGDPNVRVNNIYRFVKDAVLVFSNVQFLKEIAFADIMTSQAVRIGSSNATQYYVPNSNPLNGSVDLRKPTSIAWSSSIPLTFVVNANQPDPLNPPNRVIQYNGYCGFMLCYVLTRGQGKNIADYTNRTFEIRNNTGKVYPHPVEGSKVGATTNIGDAYSVAMARVYTDLTKTRLSNRLSVFQFKVDDETHVYIDYSGSMIDSVDLDDFSLNGKKIEILESKNTILKNNIYNQGFVVDANYVEGETCYIVLMIK